MPCTDPIYYTLVFSGTTVGTKLVAWAPNWAYATEINKRHNYWATQALLDGRYPALIWSHEFDLYLESTSVKSYMSEYFRLTSSFVTTQPRPTSICYANSPTGVVVSLGNCYLDNVSQKQPDKLLLIEAGIVTLRFLGTSIPSIL